MEKIILIGGGGHCKVIIDVLRLTKKFAIAGILDKARPLGTDVLGVPVIGTDDDLREFYRRGIRNCFIAVGNVTASSVRETLYSLAKNNGYRFPTIVHPAGTISRFAAVEAGTYVGPGAIVNAGSQIGRQCIINTGAIIDHDCSLGDFVHIGPGTSLSGGVSVGACTMIGSGASLKHGISVGNRCVIGTGSAVVADIEDNTVAYGNPARPKKRNSE